MEKQIVRKVKSKKVSKEQQSWFEYLMETRQKEPDRLEEAAKFLSGLISVCFTLLLTINEEAFIGFEKSGLVKLALGLWLISIILSLSVIFPKRYKFSAYNISSIKQLHNRIVKTKSTRLWISTSFFCAGLLILLIIFFINL